MTAPRNLDELRAIPGLQDRALAAKTYIEQRQQAISDAQAIRDQAITQLLANGGGVTAVANATGMSVSHVKRLKR